MSLNCNAIRDAIAGDMLPKPSVPGALCFAEVFQDPSRQSKPCRADQAVSPGDEAAKQLTLLFTIFWLSAMKRRPSSLHMLIHSLSHS